MEGQDAKGQDAKGDQHGGVTADTENAADHERTPHVVFERGDSMRTAMKGPRTERSVSRGRAIVDKSIEAKVKNPEVGGTARSRKASHMMGIFDPRTGSQSPALTLGEHVGSREPSKSSSRPTSPSAQEGSSHWAARRSSKEFLDATIPASREASRPASVRGSQAASPLKPDHDPYFRHQDLAVKPDVPSTLLEDIRGVYKAKIRDAEKFFESESKDQQLSEAPPGPREDEEEHISAAVYYPHPGPSPEEIERFTSPGEVLADRRQPPKLPVESVLSAEIKATDAPRATEHIDISVVSKNDKKIFHGNYHPVDEITGDLPAHTLTPVEESSSTAIVNTSESEVESGEEAGQQSQTDDTSTTPTQQSTLSGRPTEVHVPNTKAKVVLEPYKHQVGGHSTMFRFSRRAVCKQLNNRENEFYERIEQRHPDMLKFLPRYVLTHFQKLPFG